MIDKKTLFPTVLSKEEGCIFFSVTVAFMDSGSQIFRIFLDNKVSCFCVISMNCKSKQAKKVISCADELGETIKYDVERYLKKIPAALANIPDIFHMFLHPSNT